MLVSLHNRLTLHKMKLLVGILTGSLVLSAFTAPAQMGMGPRRGPEWAAMSKLFGENSTFSADVQIATKGDSPEQSMQMPGRIAFDTGKSRFELDLLKSDKMPAEALAQMKSMGMDQMVMISRPDKKTSYMIYPGLKAYVAQALSESDSKPEASFKMEVKELGKETVDGHPCIKNQATVTDDEGKKHESVVWNATDLKKFPVKIEQKTDGLTSTIMFKNVKFSKPEASQFEPPTSLKKYDNMQSMMQEEMMKRMTQGDR